MSVRCREAVLSVAVLCVVLALAPCLVAHPYSCRFRTTNSTWQACYVNSSDYCCSGAVHFEKGVINATSVLNPQGPTPTTNITFTATSDVSCSFLVRRAHGCSGPSECFDVSVSAFGAVEVQLSFVPGDEALKVTRLDLAQFHNWLSLTTTDSSPDTRFLHNSNISFDITGNDAELRVFPPDARAPVPERLATACLSLTSNSESLSCTGCSCSPSRGYTRSLCLSDPYGGNTIRVQNATGFSNGSHSSRYLWAKLQVGNACLTANQEVPLRIEVDQPNFPLEGQINLTPLWASLAAVMGVVILSVCLCRRLQRRGLGRGTRGTAAALARSAEEVPIAQGPSRYRTVLLYKQESNPNFEQIVGLLRAIIGFSDHVEVLDPYEGPMLPTGGAARWARDLLTPATNVIQDVILIATKNAFQKVGEEPGNVHDQFFEAAKLQIESHPRGYGGGRGRILTLMMSAELEGRIPIFWATRVYFLPNRISNLLSDIPGALTIDRREISNYLQQLRRAIGLYTNQ